MNNLTAQLFVRKTWRWGALLAAIFLIAGARVDAAESGRFLLVFETSPGLKKNLPVVKQALDGLFSSNLQHELKENDDLAVWTVDQALHPGAFPLASWSPDDAEVYSARLKDFLGHQKFSRHASLAAIQPLLNRVVKSSERLTVLIFCDGQSNLLGTPYDSGVNELFKKNLAESKNLQTPFILVLRSYRGEYQGCSVNRSSPLNFPPFPPPPKPEPPAVKPAPVVAPATVPAAPAPDLIIVGTKVGTNLSILTPPVSQPAPQPVTNPPATVSPAPPAPPATNPPAIAPAIVATPTISPAVVSNPPAPTSPAPAPAPVIQTNSAPESPPAIPAVVAPSNPPAASNSSKLATAAVDTATDTGFQKLIYISSGLLVTALGLVVWLATRPRHPRGSLISSSMQDDPRLPPRK